MAETDKNNLLQLRKSNIDLANYFTNTIIPQLFVDANMVLRVFTPPAMTMFSLSHKDINRDFNEVKDNIQYPTIIENIEEVIQTGNILEKEVETTDGKWFQMNILPYKDHETGKPNGVIITFVDITRRLSALRELEKLNARHDVLMFAISHDIKQPLTAMTLMADALNMANQQDDKNKIDSLATSLRTSIENIKKLIEDFTVEGDSLQPTTGEHQRVNIENIIDNVNEALKAEIKKNKISIVRDINTSEIIFPKNSLRSIVYNLVFNAIKFRRTEVPLQINISTHKMDGFVKLIVEDNGIGIEDRHQETIFEKSSRVSTAIDGTGMGLYIIKRMVESNEGKVELESQPGKGSIFSIYFKDKYVTPN